MDFKRIVLYVAIFFMLFLLWNAWVKDNARRPHRLAPATQVAPVNVPAASTTANKASTATHTTAAPVAAALQGKQISVKTDVIDAQINTAGGTITSLKLLKYPQKLGEKHNPVVLFNDKTNTQYLAQSGLMSKGKALSVIFSAPKMQYVLLPNQQQLQVQLTWRNPQGVTLIKTFVFKRNAYKVSVHYQLVNGGQSDWQGVLYNQLSRTQPKSKGFLHYTTFLGAAISTPKEHYQKYKFSSFADNPIDQQVTGGWVSMIQHYFISAIVPPAKGTTRFYSKVNQGGLYTVGMLSPAIALKPGQRYDTSYQLYAGPSDYNRLKAVAPHLNLTIDFGWLWFLSIVIFWLMMKVHLLVGNWGWSIVIVTLIIKALFYRLSASSYRSMGKMRKLQPKMKELKARFGDDRAKLGQATMELYKKEKVNPLGGCLPILIQIPVFLALYYVLIESVELRQAPFILWIHDLSIPDPFYVLPVLMGLSMFLQQRLSPTPPDPTQAKIMMFLPVILTVVFINFPAGLVLYWLVNNLASIAQQWYILKTMDRPSKKRKRKK